ncbi:MAG: hypothetical protein J6D42_06640 [Clostridia bacterium]|nr:hypothetical protein [Clostridia bacterium]
MLRQKNGESDGKHPAAVVFILPRRKMYDKKIQTVLFGCVDKSLIRKDKDQTEDFELNTILKSKYFTVCTIAVYFVPTPKRPLIIFSTVRPNRQIFSAEKNSHPP